ncbi:aminotransferase class V-fold PLP-dependent enzyme [Sulfodiicoccus acidiphilus]|uniref:Aminotransferase class V-fold PLP-dependent enzyme n=1 Tax=Sulfodiicoccus acidiphilus TaxID=1670455 RepID=A0A348B358_9CREN|nr:alanine--glyoxylate aminotransferase family protein [Sulfodiicoccus acidiphilus]BBD72610.1 aminotransferase class V-fold PLP-dependent enzyme [Sulfodiicoccus acidiphilus]GGT93350.1 aminotransferase class V-fold PLP-dependent enzyme [Sulfodiicoccus acidiphilus]
MDRVVRDRRVLMHVGPVEIELDVLLAGVRENVGFTSKEFVHAMSSALKGLRKVMGTPHYQPFIIPGGGTSAMESVTSLLKKGEKVLVVSNGVFGDRWINIFKRYPVQVDSLKAGAGDYVKPERVEQAVKSNQYTAVTLTHVETSTGVREPIKEVVERIRDNVELVVVDGVASVAGEETRAEEWKVDVILTASQKALGCPPGAGLLAISPDALSRISEESLSGYYLHLGNWLNVMRALEEGKASYFATLPVHLILMLARAFALVEEEGLENRIKRHEMVAEAIRRGVEAMGLEIVARDPSSYSNTVTGVKLSKVPASDVLNAMADAGIELAPGVHPDLANKYIRIGHMGWITPNDAIATVATLERTLNSLGESVKVGEGVRATQEYLSSRLVGL